MSPLHVYVAVEDETLLYCEAGLVYVWANDDLPFRVVEPKDDDELACAIMLPAGDIALREHPLHAYDILYPYTRTSVRLWVGDPDPQDQIAQLSPRTRYLAILVRSVDDDDQPVAIAKITVSVQPDQLYPCAAEVYDYLNDASPYLLVDSQYISLPSRVHFDVTDVLQNRRVGWIGLRRTRDSAPSGSVI